MDKSLLTSYGRAIITDAEPRDLLTGGLARHWCLVTGSRRTMIVHWPATGMFTRGSYYTFLRFHNLVRTSTLLIPMEYDILKVLQSSAYNEKDPDLIFNRRTCILYMYEKFNEAIIFLKFDVKNLILKCNSIE